MIATSIAPSTQNPLLRVHVVVQLERTNSFNNPYMANAIRNDSYKGRNVKEHVSAGLIAEISLLKA